MSKRENLMCSSNKSSSKEFRKGWESIWVKI